MPHTMLDHGHITTPTGWQAAVAACGIKYTGRDDLALVVSERACVTSALFTTNKVQSAHIHYDRAVLTRNANGIRAVLINTGSANACTGEVGIAAARATAQATEQTLSLPDESVLVMSTGVIGLHLPVDRVARGIAEAAQHLDAEAHSHAAARAIMTTDTYPKDCAAQVTLSDGSTILLGGMAKGSGMIHPNMATMLCMLTTDAVIAPDVLDAALRAAIDRSFHCISVDGDTSTNDTVVALANGMAGNTPINDIASPDGQAVLAALTDVCQHLAREVVRDGEGANHLITITVRGAPTDAEAHRAAMSVARSPLVKTALSGADPNWGRIVCALGYSGVDIVPEQVTLAFGPITVFSGGVPADFDEDAAYTLLCQPEVQIDADLGMGGNGTSTVWTCDFSCEYVKINAEYRT